MKATSLQKSLCQLDPPHTETPSLHQLQEQQLLPQAKTEMIFCHPSLILLFLPPAVSYSPHLLIGFTSGLTHD